jgi:5-formyltetrahydrofolate cyclo-ligase
MDAEKNALRHRIRASRAARSAGDRAASDAAIAERGIALAERSGVRTLACYLSGSTEPPTRSLSALATARGIRVLLPVVRPGRVLDWAEDDGSERTTRLGVHEPTGAPLGVDALAQADLILAPACAVDERGFRLGWGGGFYDRALSGPGTGIPAYAVLYDSDVVARVPHEAHDVAVDGVITPTRTLTFDR